MKMMMMHPREQEQRQVTHPTIDKSQLVMSPTNSMSDFADVQVNVGTMRGRC